MTSNLQNLGDLWDPGHGAGAVDLHHHQKQGGDAALLQVFSAKLTWVKKDLFDWLLHGRHIYQGGNKTWKLSCFRIGFFLCMAILCISCPLRTFIRKNTRLVPLKVTIIKIRQPWPFWSKSNAIIAIWQNKYVKLSPKVRKVYFYDPGKMPLLRCAASFKTNSKMFNFSKPILKFPSFQFLIINTKFFNFLIFQNQFCSFFHFFSSISMQSCRRAPWYGEHEHERGSSQFEPQHRRRHEERLQDEQPWGGLIIMKMESNYRAILDFWEIVLHFLSHTKSSGPKLMKGCH